MGVLAHVAIGLLSFIAILCAPLPTSAQETIPLVVPRIQIAPVIDGILGDDEWRHAAPLTLAYQTQPGDNVPPTERTEIRLAYDPTHLYVAVRAWETDAGAIRGRVTRRDDIGGEDHVSFYFDTYDDRRRAYVFSFNPLGIQSDGLYQEGGTTARNFDGNIDRTWDGVLTSKGLVTDDGYVVEAAIPFRTMRYQAGAERMWGLHVQRWIARKGESVSWQPISREVTSLLTQMGRIGGLTELGGDSSIDVIPTITSAVVGDRQPDETLTNTGNVDPGATVNWSVTPNLTLSGTVNPDFSQIEADVPQIDVNQRFPLLYPERRPFFLEGGQFFRSPGALNFLNTRQIVDPDWGGKLTTKLGRNTVAVLAAGDAAPGRAAAPGQVGSGDVAQFAVARYQRDVLQNSTVGSFVTTRRFAGDDNAIAAVDGQIRLPLQTIGFQLGKSFTDTRGLTSTGDATYVWYDFVGRHWRFFVNDLRISGDYRADTAFVARTGIQGNATTFGYEFQGDNTWWVRVRPFIAARAARTPNRLLDQSYFDPGADITLARDITIYTYYSNKWDAFLGREYHTRAYHANYTVNTFKRVTFNGSLRVGEAVNFNPAAPQVGSNVDSSLTVTLKPNDKLNSEFLYLKSRLTAFSSGQELFDQNVLRNRTNYQFTREHAGRSILEYNTLSRRVSISLLYTFLPRPNSAVYAGYGDLLLNDVDPLTRDRRDGLHRVRRTFFVKISHNFRR
ncbi:MAG: carbohydrate binding family 9 domain-containing protein [Vicinamibacterales bacterium]